MTGAGANLRPGDALELLYDWSFIAVSFLCSVIGSWTALILGTTPRPPLYHPAAATDVTRLWYQLPSAVLPAVEEAVLQKWQDGSYYVWVLGSAVAFGGCAVFNTHLAGCGAFHLPGNVPVSWDWTQVCLSLLPAIVLSCCGFSLVMFSPTITATAVKSLQVRRLVEDFNEAPEASASHGPHRSPFVGSSTSRKQPQPQPFRDSPPPTPAPPQQPEGSRSQRTAVVAGSTGDIMELKQRRASPAAVLTASRSSPHSLKSVRQVRTASIPARLVG